MLIAIIDDHLVLTQAIKTILIEQKDIEEVKIYESGDAFFSERFIKMPDIIITDLMMPGMNGMEVLEQCNTIYKGEAKIIVLSSITDVQTIRQAIRNKASGFLPKSASIEELIEAIYEIKSGKQYIGKQLRETLLENVFTGEQIVYHLSPREKEVLQGVCNGHTIKEIAHELKLSVHTVQYYHRCVMEKFKVKRTTDLIVFAMQHGLYIPPISNGAINI